jgi:hypothetical protein
MLIDWKEPISMKYLCYVLNLPHSLHFNYLIHKGCFNPLEIFSIRSIFMEGVALLGILFLHATLIGRLGNLIQFL